MKILQISPVFYPAWKRGGIVSAVYNLSKELVHRGHDVTVYTTDNIDEKTRMRDKYIEVEGIKVYYFRNVSNKLAWDNNFFPPSMFLQIAKRIKDFDIIHLQDYRFIPHIVAYYCAALCDIPIVFQPRYAYMTFFHKEKLKKLFDLTFGNRILQNATMLIAQLPREAKEYQNLGIDNNRIAIIPNGLDFRELIHLPNRGIFRRKYGFSNEQKIVLYLGRIEKIKGIDLLIQAYANLIKMNDDIVLVIIGPDAGYLNQMKRLIIDLGLDNRVLLIGSLKGENKLAAFIDADVYVLPSFYEGLSIAPLEAYACGTPVVITDRCGTGEWMDDEFDYIVPYDKEQLTHAIIQGLNNTNKDMYSEKEIERRIKLIQERFSWTHCCELTEEVYRKAIEFKSE
jgi:glycosyltransferase involved in cell wall biosynthesis